MRKLFLIISLLFNLTQSMAQLNDNNAFVNYMEFKTNQPSLKFDFYLKQRSSFDIFMIGGMRNYMVKKIKPKSEKFHLIERVWGIVHDGNYYINAYPYSGLRGYNLLLENGYYSYFIGELAIEEDLQRSLGIIKPNEKVLRMYGRVGYVILPDGTIKMLQQDLLRELCSDNRELILEINYGNYKIKDTMKMFEILKKYNTYKRNNKG
jgi:hypothetical protein